MSNNSLNPKPQQEGTGSAQFEVGQGGVWRRKYSKFVTGLKHALLKMTGSKCAQKDLPH